MSILLTILIVAFICIVGGGVVLLRSFSTKLVVEQTKRFAEVLPIEKTAKTSFKWSFVILPTVVLLAALGIVIYFSGKLPVVVAYSFNPDGAPMAWLARTDIILWAVVPQILLTLLAAVITFGTGKVNDLLKPAENAGIKLNAILFVMSNMVVIPQLVLFFAMLNIFSYNSFQTHISFILGTAIAIIIMGVVFLSAFFISVFRRVRSFSK